MFPDLVVTQRTINNEVHLNLLRSYKLPLLKKAFTVDKSEVGMFGERRIVIIIQRILYIALLCKGHWCIIHH